MNDEGNNKEKSCNQKNISIKYRFQIKKIVILLIIIFFVCLLFYKTEKIYKLQNTKIKYQKFIEKGSDKKLSYIGKLKYIRTNYNAVSIDNNSFFVIGKGKDKDEISRKAEIFDINKGETIKVIKLKKSHNNDFLYKLSNNNILIIGKSIELVDLNSYTSKEILLPDKTYQYTKGFAEQINENEILIILGNTIIKRNKSINEKKLYIYNLKNETIEELNDNFSTKKSLFYDYTKNLLANVNNEIYFFDCNYNEIKNANTVEFSATNCYVNTYDKINKRFIPVIKIPQDSFPIDIIKINKDSLVLRTLSNVMIYYTKDNTFIPIVDDLNLLYPSHYFIKIADNEIMALGNLFLDFPNFEKETTQYIIEIDNKLVKPYKLIDFNNLSTYSYKYGCVLNTNKNQTIFIGLLGSNIIYSSLR